MLISELQQRLTVSWNRTNPHIHLIVNIPVNNIFLKITLKIIIFCQESPKYWYEVFKNPSVLFELTFVCKCEVWGISGMLINWDNLHIFPHSFHSGQLLNKPVPLNPCSGCCTTQSSWGQGALAVGSSALRKMRDPGRILSCPIVF